MQLPQPDRAKAPAVVNTAPVAWIVVIAITLAQATEAFTVQGFPALAPFVAEEFAISKARLGMLTSSFFAGGFISVIPAGWAIDRIGVRRSLAIGLGLMAVTVALGALTHSFWMLYACLLLAGIGFGSVYPATTKAVMHWAPPRLRGTMMGIKQTGVPAGGALAAVTLPVLALSLGWRGALLIAAAACAVCLVACHVLYRTHPDEIHAAVRGGRPGPHADGRAPLRAALRNRDIWLVNISGLFFLATQSTMIAWLISYLRSELAMPVVAAGTVLAAMQIGGAAGRLGWGTVSDLVFGGRRVPIIALLGVGTGAVLWILSFLTQAGYGTLVVVSLLAGLCGIGWVGMVTVLRAELAPREGVGIVTSLGSFMGYAGSLLGPPLFGLLLDRTGDYRLAWRLLGLCAVLAGLLVLRARERTQPGANPIA
ncbi:MAG: MFS transporter [Bacillota bacterium]|nr:MFS transporter [Bacillota bacterium]